jgi:hypothetical protein
MPRPKRLPKTKLATLFPLSPIDLLVLANCAHAVWNNIGFDVLEGVPRQTISRAAVIEVVVDADRLAEQVRRDARASDALKALFPNAWDRNAADYRDLLLRDVFQYSTYGM